MAATFVRSRGNEEFLWNHLNFRKEIKKKFSQLEQWLFMAAMLLARSWFNKVWYQLT